MPETTRVKRIVAFLRRRWFFVMLALLLIIVAAAFLFRQERTVSTEAARDRRAAVAISVAAVPAENKDFRIYLNGLGTVTSLNTVTVRTRVDGELIEVRYREGQIVNRGDLLVRVDPRPFVVQLTQAEGQLARDEELLKNALVDLDRYRVLWKKDSIPKQQLDTQESLVRQLEGTVKADQGQVDSAKLQLVYCRVIAPVSGRVGLRLVDPGNIVHAADTNGLVVITQIQPITVIFPIPEDRLPQVLAKIKEGKPMPVEAYDREVRKKLADGVLATVDNQIDTTTGTIRLRADFPNKNNELFPNQFVNARLLIDIHRDATVVPAAGLQRGPQGQFVYVVRDGTAAIRPVTVGEIQSAEAFVVKGLQPGELVVVEGAERLRDGARVELRAQSAGTTQKGS